MFSLILQGFLKEKRISEDYTIWRRNIDKFHKTENKESTWIGGMSAKKRLTKQAHGQIRSLYYYIASTIKFARLLALNSAPRDRHPLRSGSLKWLLAHPHQQKRHTLRACLFCWCRWWDSEPRRASSASSCTKRSEMEKLSAA